MSERISDERLRRFAGFEIAEWDRTMMEERGAMAGELLTARAEIARLIRERDDLAQQLAGMKAEFERLATERQRSEAQVARLREALDTPETADFDKGVPLEAAHQVGRWGAEHDAGKTPADWFWLVGYLAGKCLAAHIAGNQEKALHHTISTAAVLRNWHRAIATGTSLMRPGLAEEKTAALAAPEPPK